MTLSPRTFGASRPQARLIVGQIEARFVPEKRSRKNMLDRLGRSATLGRLPEFSKGIVDGGWRAVSSPRA
jgi:hypothetical protein